MRDDNPKSQDPNRTLGMLRGKYPRVLDMKSTEFHPLFGDPESSAAAALEIHYSQADGPLDHAVLLWTKQDFGELARHILSTLDPVTNEQLLEEIRKLLEDQK